MKIPLNKGLHTTVDAKDYQRCVVGPKWYAWASRRNDGTVRTHYAARNVVNEDGSHTIQLMHRFILGLTNPKEQADHEDGDGLNNRRRNLSKVTNLQNSQNRVRVSTKNSSGVTGVSWDKKNNKWLAEIVSCDEYIFLGRFIKLEDAKNVRKEAERERDKQRKVQADSATQQEIGQGVH